MEYSKAALFTDLDGTLFDSQSKISEKNKEAIRRFTAQGGSFGISTGRGPTNARAKLPGVEINAWSVVLNGAEAYHYGMGQAAHQTFLNRDISEKLMAWVIETLPEVNIMVCTEAGYLFPSDPAYGDPWFVDNHQPMPVVTLEESRAYPWLKILYCAPRPILEKIKTQGQNMGAEAVMDSLYTHELYLEYIPPRVNKGTCLKKLRQQPELQGKTILAVGDYTNDLELLQEADIAVAVSNALEEVKQAADYVICSNDEDAIAYLIDVLIPSL